MTNPGAMSTSSTQTVALKYHFLEKEMDDFRSGKGNVQDKPGIPGHTRLQRNSPDCQNHIKRIQGPSSKRLPLSKDGMFYSSKG